MIFEKVRDALAAQFELDAESVTMETNLIDDLGADSVDLVELVMAMEEELLLRMVHSTWAISVP